MPSKKYAGGERDKTGRNCRGANWRDEVDIEIIYHQADFSNSYFDSSGFSGCDLSFSKFLYVRMYEGGFADCYMPGANFTYATFGQVVFNDVDLRSAIFKNTDLVETSFRRCNLAYADFTGAREFFRPFKECLIYETIMPDGSIRTDDV
ncbi:pentapeptide repeat-containing protein [Aliterella atlantica]|uniref:pentapeptide repeat-containing protein n=1 Tax=Aliterella atlantica TaxID=1827278 RepID=UPI000907FD6C|nr:pentapeptide repeat-containing protein [Aliterella atlantica]